MSNTLTTSDISEFMKCSTKFKIKRENDYNKMDKMFITNTIKNTMMFYWDQKVAGVKVTLEDLMQQWSNYFYHEEDYKEYIKKFRYFKFNDNNYVNKKDKFKKEVKSEIKRILSKFHKEFEERDSIPVSFNTQYTFKIGDYEIVGTIPYTEEEDGELKVYSFFDYKINTNEDLRKLDNIHPIDYRAAKGIFDKPFKFYAYNIYYHKRSEIKISNYDTNRSLEQIANIIGMINGNVYFKNVGEHCKQCSYQEECKLVKFREDDKD